MTSKQVQFISLSVSLLTVCAHACSVPVFRYALERWKSEPYEVYVFHKGPLSEIDQALADTLRKAGEDDGGFANFEFTMVNTAEKMSPEVEKAWKAQDNSPQPWLAVYYPQSDPSRPPLWAAKFNAENAKELTDSPVRSEIGKRLTQGESVVWLLLESGKKDADDAAAKLLADEFKRLTAEIKLPDPNEATEDEIPVRLNSALPLKLLLTTLRLSRDDPREHLLIKMLLQSDKKFKDLKEPIAFPIFGRGRMLDGLFGKALKAGQIQDATAFLTGACSCQVKELNPGMDLLMNLDWEIIFDEERLAKAGVKLARNRDENVGKNDIRKKPEITAPAALTTVDAEKKTAAPPGKPAKASVTASDAAPKINTPASAVPEAPAIPRGLLWIGLVVAGILVLVTGKKILKQNG